MPRSHFTPGKDPVPILQEAGCAPGPVWTGGKSRPHPDRPARSSVTIPTELPGTQKEGKKCKIQHCFFCLVVPTSFTVIYNNILKSLCVVKWQLDGNYAGIILYYVMLRYVTLRYVTSRHVTSRHVTSSHVILYYIILYYIILYYIILYYIKIYGLYCLSLWRSGWNWNRHIEAATDAMSHGSFWKAPD